MPIHIAERRVEQIGEDRIVIGEWVVFADQSSQLIGKQRRLGLGRGRAAGTFGFTARDLLATQFYKVQALVEELLIAIEKRGHAGRLVVRLIVLARLSLLVSRSRFGCWFLHTDRWHR